MDWINNNFLTISFIISVILIIWNIIVFAMYGIDKKKAKNNKWRIKESALILCAFLMGATGAFFGMNIFRHKTQNKKFIILIPISVITNIAVIVCTVYFLIK